VTLIFQRLIIDNTVDAGLDSEASKFFTKAVFQCVTEPTRARGKKPSVLDYTIRDEENLVDFINYKSPVGKVTMFV